MERRVEQGKGSPAELAFQARGLVKRYADLVAVDGIDLEARRGACLAVLGPNGAGKTTTIEMLEGLKTPDAGEIEVLGRRWASDGSEIRQRIGVQLQETQLQEKLTVFETLRLFASFYRQRRDIDEVLEAVGLSEKRGGRVEALSGGQKQRLTLGCALINRPEVLFLDEPTTGLDPQARRRIWEIVGEFTAAGGTALLTTHYMEEAERLADRVVIVDRGKVIARGTPAEIVASLGAESIIEIDLVGTGDGGGASRLDPDALGALPGVRSVRADPNRVSLNVTDTRASLGALLVHLREREVALEDLHTHRPTLEDVFVALTGKHLRDG